MHFLFILMLQFGLVSHNGLILIGNIRLIELSLKHTFFNLSRPTNTFLSIETITLDSSHNSLRFDK
jgi:hypothetical protein